MTPLEGDLNLLTNLLTNRPGIAIFLISVICWVLIMFYYFVWNKVSNLDFWKEDSHKSQTEYSSKSPEYLFKAYRSEKLLHGNAIEMVASARLEKERSLEEGNLKRFRQALKHEAQGEEIRTAKSNEIDKIVSEITRLCKI